MKVIPSYSPIEVARRSVGSVVGFLLILIGIRLVLLFSSMQADDLFLLGGGIVDCAILAAFAYWIHRMNKIGTILLPLYLLFQQIGIYSSFGGAAVSLPRIILFFAAMFLSIRGIFACFRYHALKLQSPSEAGTDTPAELNQR